MNRAAPGKVEMKHSADRTTIQPTRLLANEQFCLELRGRPYTLYHGCWMVNEDYVIKDDHLCIARPYHEWYNPIDQQELPGAIAKVRAGDTKALLQFARTYGMLGYRNLYRPHQRASGRPQHNGEPLGWLWTHINTIHLCLELQRYVNEQRDAWEIEDCIERHGGRKPYGTNTYEIPIAAKSQTDVVQQSREPQESIYDVAQRLRHEIIQRNIQDIRYGLQYRDGQPPQRTVSFASLIEVVYWHLAEMAHKPVKPCEWCGALFIVQYEIQQYCPHPDPSKYSRCGANARKAKQRQTKRGSIP